MVRSTSIRLATLLLASAGVLTWVSGCGRQAQQPAPETPQAHLHDGHEHAHGHGHADAQEIAAELAKLSPEDRALAEKQKVCPVGGEPLGSMGPPIKLVVEGREVFICCAGCEDAIRDEPEKYLRKLDHDRH
ncbi:MAG: hypothetical protein KF861_05840 [Planctomycetaceae bacterium]|nr:hypothetical protein [Planctomycetaceae bacterium]